MAGGRARTKAEQRLITQPPSRASAKQEQERAGPELAASADIAQRRQAFREHIAALRQERDAAAVPAPAVTPDPPSQQAAVEKETEQKQDQVQKIEHPGFGFGR